MVAVEPIDECRPRLTAAVLVAVDVGTVFLVTVVAYLIAQSVVGDLTVNRYLPLFGVCVLVPLAFHGAQLYKGPSLAEEIRAIFFRSSLIWVALMASTFLTREAERYSRLLIFLAWFGSVFGLVALRLVVRLIFAHRPWWGSPVLILGTRTAADGVIRHLWDHPSRGLKPAAVLICGSDSHVTQVHNVPVLGTCNQAEEVRREWGLGRAILALKGLDKDRQQELTERNAHVFNQLAVIPDLAGFSSLWVDARDYGGMLGLHVKPALFDPWARFCKRFWDVSLSLSGLILLAPALAIIALAIKLTSPGPVFYSHWRLGRGGRFFRMWKLRTMVADADERLQEYLDAHPEARAEWDAQQKLQDDPRVTGVGRLLRKSSMDELPQLWNVLNGTMSLVGPRPVPDDGIAKFESYGFPYCEYYKLVRPGISGLWQVEGRSAVSYDARVDLDLRYIRNWSVWLDWEILVKTARAVTSGRGAV